MKQASYTKKGSGRKHADGRMEKLQIAFSQLGGNRKLGSFALWVHHGELTLQNGRNKQISYSPICFPFHKRQRKLLHQIRTARCVPNEVLVAMTKARKVKQKDLPF